MIKFQAQTSSQMQCDNLIMFAGKQSESGFSQLIFLEVQWTKVIALAGMGTITGTLLARGIVIGLPVANQNVTDVAFWLA